VREQLAAWARAAVRNASRRSGDSPPRVLDAGLLHVTLCFLGNRPVGEIDSVGTRLASCDGLPGELSVGAPLWLPARHPRALAVELHDEGGRLARLQAQVVRMLEEVSGWQAGAGRRASSDAKARRSFHPHITVARLRRGAAPRERILPPTPPLAFVPSKLVLYRSWLSPEGASYEAVAAHPIG
jgi:2'-5' RNA ligase